MPANINKLKEAITRKGTSNEELSKKIGINSSTFYRKLKSSEKSFSVEEVIKIADALKLTKSEAVDIFFDGKLAETQENEKQTDDAIAS